MKLRIYLADLTHTGLMSATEAFPLNIGLIASYCKKNFSNDVDIKLFKFPKDLKGAIDEKLPHVLGCSNYTWNCNLSYHFASYVKSLDKNIITVFGGTNYPYDKYNQELFLKKRPNINIHTFYEGERSFSKIIERLLSNNNDAKKVFDTPIPGCQFIKKNKLISGEQMQRIKFLDEIPSPYTSGLLDKFFKYKLTPLVETARGCPFKCNFCNAGDDYYNKVNQFSNDYVNEELTHIAKMSNKYNIKHITFADNNFGMIPRDRTTVELIKSLQEKYSFPSTMTVWTGKNSKEKIIDATRLLGETLSISMSPQSMDQKVLNKISRSNIKVEHMKSIAKELSDQGRPQHAEVIMPLPEETLETHINGLADLLDTDVSSVLSHQLQMLHGTPYLDDKEYVKKYAYETKYRLVPLDYGKYDGTYVFDYEKIAIATKSFSFEDYIKARKFLLIIAICSNSNTFIPLKKYLLSNNFKKSDWIKYIYKNLDKFDTSIKNIFKSFVDETKSELWDSEKDLVNHYSNEKNYQKLLKGDAGGNVLFRHKIMTLNANLEILVNDVFKLTNGFIKSKNANLINSNFNSEINELKKYILGMTADSFDFRKNIDQNKKLNFKYDILSWLKTNEKTKLKDYYRPNSVEISFIYKQHQIDMKLDAKDRYGDNLSGLVKLVQRVEGNFYKLHRKAVLQ